MRSEDHPLDTLIDDTARGMTDGAPSPSMRAAIRGGIETPSRTWRPASAGPRLVWSAAAAAAALVLIVALGRDEAPVPIVPAVPPAAAEGRSPAAPSVPVALAASAVERPAARETAGVEAPAALPEDALVIELMEIEPLQPDPLEFELMEVPMPLRADAIEIEPLPVE